MFSKDDNPSDKDIIQGLQEGGERKTECTNYLYDKYIRFVRKGRNRYHLSEHQARSAYNDAIIKCTESVAAGKFEEKSKLSTYLYKIFRNECVNQKGDSPTNKEYSWNLLSLLPDASKDLSELLITKERFEQVKACIKKLDEKCRQLIWKTGYEGYSNAELAEIMGYKNKQVVAVQKNRCMKQLKNLLKNKH